MTNYNDKNLFKLHLLINSEAVKMLKNISVISLLLHLHYKF